jgi:transposase-like protein
LLTAKRDLDAAKRFFRKALKDEPLLAPGEIGTDGANVYPKAISDGAQEALTPSDVQHRVSKHLQQGIESDHFQCEEEHAEDRRLPVIRHGEANHRRFRGDAVVEEGLPLRRRMNRSPSE